MIPGAFVDWDNTPRHKHRGQITLNATPQKFKLYLSKQIKRTREIYAKDILLCLLGMSGEKGASGARSKKWICIFRSGS